MYTDKEYIKGLIPEYGVTLVTSYNESDLELGRELIASLLKSAMEGKKIPGRSVIKPRAIKVVGSHYSEAFRDYETPEHNSFANTGLNSITERIKNDFEREDLYDVVYVVYDLDDQIYQDSAFKELQGPVSYRLYQYLKELSRVSMYVEASVIVFAGAMPYKTGLMKLYEPECEIFVQEDVDGYVHLESAIRRRDDIFDVWYDDIVFFHDSENRAKTPELVTDEDMLAEANSHRILENGRSELISMDVLTPAAFDDND